jgi:hypothetical protein
MKPHASHAHDSASLYPGSYTRIRGLWSQYSPTSSPLFLTALLRTPSSTSQSVYCSHFFSSSHPPFCSFLGGGGEGGPLQELEACRCIPTPTGTSATRSLSSSLAYSLYHSRTPPARHPNYLIIPVPPLINSSIATASHKQSRQSKTLCQLSCYSHSHSLPLSPFFSCVIYTSFPCPASSTHLFQFHISSL